MKEIIDKCLLHRINLYSYFILYCLYYEEEELLTQYCLKIDRIDTNNFTSLIKEGYLEKVKDEKVITLEDLVLTDKFKTEVLKVSDTKNITFDQAFEQLREHYPSKAGNSERRLQGDVERCKRLYQNIIVKNGKMDESLHSVILQCINFEINLRTKNRSLEYFQMLATWLQQKTYTLYIDDVERIIKNKGTVEKIVNNTGGFTEDV